ncbi:unnamed protein product [Protopolystoma xenopodis]|uniref:30S ribosomal protein S9 n=1 Tax=Protopolystoma xenopodis TaxID=117903 RepID=A0A3S4ZQ15_9PLAT|nr:unnamed protein product [Protopolystoma xenopodis]
MERFYRLAQAFLFPQMTDSLRKYSGNPNTTGFTRCAHIHPLSTNRRYTESYGQKKTAFAEVRLYSPGSGEFRVNGFRLLDVFPEIGDREQIMLPLCLLGHTFRLNQQNILSFSGKLGCVDIVATVSQSGPASQANAIRLAISRALVSFDKYPLDGEQSKITQIGETETERLRVAGLLTQDDRFPERKKPGQKKARKKPIW